MPFAGLFSTIGNIATGLINSQSQYETNVHNEWLAKQQNHWNRQNWFNAMGYDAPINQIQRLKAAGLNPALVYGNGIENVSPTAPDMVSSQGVAPNIGSPFTNLSRELLQQELTESQVNLNNSTANRNNAQAGLYTTQTDIAGVRFKILSKNGEVLSDLEVKTMEKHLDLLQESIANMSADTAVKLLEGEKLRNYIDKIQPAELQKIQSEIGLNEAQTKQILELIPYEIALKKAMTSNQYSQAQLASAQAKWQETLNNSDEYVQEFIRGLRLNNEGKIISMDIDLGNNRSAAAVGASLSDHYSGDYANVAKPASGADYGINGISTLFGVLGRLFSGIVKG